MYFFPTQIIVISILELLLIATAALRKGGLLEKFIFYLFYIIGSDTASSEPTPPPCVRGLSILFSNFFHFAKVFFRGSFMDFWRYDTTPP